MDEIKPRWVWRSLGRRFAVAQRRLAALMSQGFQESEEVYRLASGGSNVNVLSALTNINILKQVDADGLEQ